MFSIPTGKANFSFTLAHNASFVALGTFFQLLVVIQDANWSLTTEPTMFQNLAAIPSGWTGSPLSPNFSITSCPLSGIWFLLLRPCFLFGSLLEVVVVVLKGCGAETSASWATMVDALQRRATDQMHLDGINIFSFMFVATVTIRTTYLLYHGNLSMLLHNLEKL
jgi:hypothetical protein